MVMFLWVLELCRLVGRCQRFGETYCFHLQDWSAKDRDRRQNSEERNHRERPNLRDSLRAHMVVKCLETRTWFY
jgi:hypothetical protein